MPIDKKCVVYCMTSPVGKDYVGISTASIKARMYGHKSAAVKGVRTAICNAIRKYGIENFSINQLAEGTFAECVFLEKKFIKDRRCRSPFGYNLTDGGEGSPGVVPSKEAIEKRRFGAIGKKRSAEFCANVGNRRRGAITTDETRARQVSSGISRASNPVERARLREIGTKHPPHVLEKIRNANLGHRASEETRRKMSEKQRCRQASPEFRAEMSEKIRTSWVLRKQKREESWLE